jgi:hypothetical protein
MIAPLVTDNEKVKERNRIAVEYMTQHGIEVDDLFGLVAEHPEYYNLPQDGNHFNPPRAGPSKAGWICGE